MGRYRKFLVAAFMIVLAGCATTERVADVPSRPGITERVLVLAPENPKAVGTSRGTQSVAFVATMLPAAEGGPDGIVLTSTILTDPGSPPVPAMPLANITAPVLVAHHKLDGCGFCNYRDLPKLMDKLTAVPRKELLTFEGGMNRGDPCDAMAYHGFNGIEQEVVAKVAEWITRK